MVYLHLITSLPHWTNNTLPRGQTCDLSSISTGHSFPRGSNPQTFNITSCRPQWVRPCFHVHSPTASVSAQHKTVLPKPRPPFTRWCCSYHPLHCLRKAPSPFGGSTALLEMRTTNTQLPQPALRQKNKRGLGDRHVRLQILMVRAQQQAFLRWR